MFNVSQLSADHEPRISYYSDGADTDGLPSLWDDPAEGRTKIAVFRLDDGTLYMTSDDEAIEFAESYC